MGDSGVGGQVQDILIRRDLRRCRPGPSSRNWPAAERHPGQPAGPASTPCLTGTWLSDGYECYTPGHGAESRLPIKRVSVSHIGEDLIAVKIDGDLCVPAGHVTFRPVFQKFAARCGDLDCRCAGAPRQWDRPRGTLKIIDRDHFRTDDFIPARSSFRPGRALRRKRDPRPG